MIQESRKILIVEDAPTQRAILANLVTELGLIPVFPPSFDDAILNTINSNSIKIVLLDLILVDNDGQPIGDGFQICNDIKTIDPSVKVIVISAESDEAARNFALSQGANGFISKPFKIEELEHALTSVGLD